jgi:hypothetical protein
MIKHVRKRQTGKEEIVAKNMQPAPVMVRKYWWTVHPPRCIQNNKTGNVIC